jgi:hypothetical protein
LISWVGKVARTGLGGGGGRLAAIGCVYRGPAPIGATG